MQWTFNIGHTVFNSVDMVLFLILLIGGIGGAIKGFAVSFSRFAGYIIGFFTGLMFTVPLAELFSTTFSISLFLSSLSAFVLLFIIGYSLVRILGRVFEQLNENFEGLYVMDKVFGFFWSLFLTFLLLTVICYFLSRQSVFQLDSFFARSQFSTRLMSPVIERAGGFVKEFIR